MLQPVYLNFFSKTTTRAPFSGKYEVSRTQGYNFVQNKSHFLDKDKIQALD